MDLEFDEILSDIQDLLYTIPLSKLEPNCDSFSPVLPCLKRIRLSSH